MWGFASGPFCILLARWLVAVIRLHAGVFGRMQRRWSDRCPLRDNQQEKWLKRRAALEDVNEAAVAWVMSEPEYISFKQSEEQHWRLLSTEKMLSLFSRLALVRVFWAVCWKTNMTTSTGLWKNVMRIFPPFDDNLLTKKWSINEVYSNNEKKKLFAVLDCNQISCIHSHAV